MKTKIKKAMTFACMVIVLGTQALLREAGAYKNQSISEEIDAIN